MSSSSLSLSSLELSDTQVYEPHIRALLGTDLHFCEVVVLQQTRTPPGTRGRVPRGEGLVGRYDARVVVEREFFIDNLLVRIHLTIEMILVDRPCAMGA